MKFETKFALGEKVISKIDGGFCGAVVVAVVIRSTTDGEHINYELVCSVPLPPEVTKKSGRKFEKRSTFATEAELIEYKQEYVDREKRLTKEAKTDG